MTEQEPTLTLALDGEVPLDLFAEAVRGFQELVDALSDDVGQDAMPWVLDDLEFGSATMVVRSEAGATEPVQRIQKAFAAVGRSLEHHEAIPYSQRVASAARRISSVLNGRITSVRFEAGDETATVTSGADSPARSVVSAYGSVEGTVESASKRKRVRFTLYDFLNDRAVACYLAPNQSDLVRDAWGRRVLVRGWLTRDAVTGSPIRVSPVETVEVLPDVEAGSYQRARGVLAHMFDEEAPEAAVRRLRDA